LIDSSVGLFNGIGLIRVRLELLEGSIEDSIESLIECPIGGSIGALTEGSGSKEIENLFPMQN